MRVMAIPPWGPGVSKHRRWKGAGMAEYRAYTVGRDGHFVGVKTLTGADDAEAIDKAKPFVDGHDIELWNGDRLVTRLETSTK
jgi:hypothetical protein